jgi:hypothetical protein
MEGTIVVSPGLPEVAPENAESLGFLSELISDSLGRLDSLKRSANTAILDLLKANVRLGWYLEDARHFLRKEGTYVAWIEQTCPLSYGHTTRLRQEGWLQNRRDLGGSRLRGKAGAHQTREGPGVAVGPQGRCDPRHRADPVGALGHVRRASLTCFKFRLVSSPPLGGSVDTNGGRPNDSIRDIWLGLYTAFH